MSFMNSWIFMFSNKKEKAKMSQEQNKEELIKLYEEKLERINSDEYEFMEYIFIHKAKKFIACWEEKKEIETRLKQLKFEEDESDSGA